MYALIQQNVIAIVSQMSTHTNHELVIRKTKLSSVVRKRKLSSVFLQLFTTRVCTTSLAAACFKNRRCWCSHWPCFFYIEPGRCIGQPYNST